MAIEPIKGFYVHDEMTDTDGVAKYSADSLVNLDDTVSLVGYAPDAKAVGDRLTATEETANHADELAETLNEGGLELKDSVIEGQVDTWLDDHPEATTTVQDGAITKAKINTAFLPEIENAYVTPEMFGAVGDGVADDTVAVQEAFNSSNSVLLKNRYLVTETVTFTSAEQTISGDGFIVYDGVGQWAVILGTQSRMTPRMTAKLNVIKKTADLYGPGGIQVINSVLGDYNFYARGFSTGVEIVGDGYDCNYNKVYLKCSESNRTNLRIATRNSGACNQNTFIAGSCRISSDVLSLIHEGDEFYDLQMENDGVHIINNTTFFGTSFEGNGTNKSVVNNNGHNTVFVNCRYEGVKIREGEYALGARYIDGFGLETAIETVTPTAQIMSGKRQYLYSEASFKYHFGASGSFIIENAGNSEMFKVTSAGVGTFYGNLTAGGELSLKTSHTNPFRLAAADTEPTITDRNFGSIFVNGGGNGYEKRLSVYDRGAWQNILYSVARPTTERPTGVQNGYMMFDTTLNKPIWYNNGNWYDATGAQV